MMINLMSRILKHPNEDTTHNHTFVHDPSIYTQYTGMLINLSHRILSFPEKWINISEGGLREHDKDSDA